LPRSNSDSASSFGLVPAFKLLSYAYFHPGFVIFELSEEHHKIIQDYLTVGKEFFALPPESKSTLAEIDDLAGKKNKGYVNVAGVKEFLKLKQSDAKQLPKTILDAVPELPTRFQALNDMFLSLATMCVTFQRRKPYRDRCLFLIPGFLGFSTPFRF
jgi:isopenicillin N synthase-like dioxygenase